MAEKNTNINAIWHKFTTSLKTTKQQHIPHKTARPRETSQWIEKEIKKLIRKRDRLHKKMNKSQDQQHQMNYKNCKHLVQKKLRKAYWTYVDDIVTQQPKITTYTTARNVFGPSSNTRKKTTKHVQALKNMDNSTLTKNPKHTYSTGSFNLYLPKTSRSLLMASRRETTSTHSQPIPWPQIYPSPLLVLPNSFSRSTRTKLQDPTP